MNTVYVVMQVWQDYGGSDSSPILVTPDINVAEAKVEEMKARQKVRGSVYGLIQEFMKAWEAVNPRPRQVLDKKKKTKENPIPLDEQFRNWAQARYAEQVRFTATFTEAEQADFRELNDDLIWEIETVPYEE